MPQKTCFKCKIKKDITYFYKHAMMADGHLNKCKECAKKDSNERRYNPLFRDKVLEYDRGRGKTEKRKKTAIIRYKQAKKNHPEKWKARYVLNKDLNLGRIKKFPCEVCREVKSEAHHPDYSKPLEVIWLCRKHHNIIHRQPVLKSVF